MAKKEIYYSNSERNFSIVLDEIMSSTDFKERLMKYYEKQISLSGGYNTETFAIYNNRWNILQDRTYMSGEDIALVTGVKKSTVSRWIARQNPAIPDITVITKLSEVFKVSTDYLLGIAPLEDKKQLEDFEVLEKYGIDHRAFTNLYLLKYNNPEQYMYVIEGVNLLLRQEDSPFGILNKIGNYLMAQRMKGGYFYFDEDDLWNLCEQLKSDNMNEETIKETLDDFRDNQCTPFSMNTVNQPMLDSIVEEIVKYKKVVTPSFFEQEDNIEHLFENKTETATDTDTKSDTE